MADANDPKQKVRTRRKLAQRNADLKQTRLKIKPRKKVNLGSGQKISHHDFRLQRGNVDLSGRMTYSPNLKDIDVSVIYPTRNKQSGIMSLQPIHDKVKGTLMDKKLLREGLQGLSKKFPETKKISGMRVTGAKARLGEFDENRYQTFEKKESGRWGVKRNKPKEIKLSGSSSTTSVPNRKEAERIRRQNDSAFNARRRQARVNLDLIDAPPTPKEGFLARAGKVLNKLGRGSTKVSAIGTALDFKDFYDTMEAARKKRKRAQQGFLPGGST